MHPTADLTGILAAVVTPFTPDGASVDEDGIRRQAEHIIGAGVHGLVPGGSTGEFTTLSLEERKRANAVYVEAADGRVPVIAGTGALSTAETVELSRHASDVGAAGVMVVPPFYGSLGFPELLAHYQAVSDAIDVPIMYYNIPSNTGTHLTAEQFVELAEKTRVTSFKDTGGDAVAFDAMLSRHSDAITPLNGWDTLTFHALAAGAKAGVWGAASIVPGLAVALYEAVAVRSDLAEGRRLWELIEPLCTFLESHDYAVSIKAGVELVGVGAGPVRRPALPLARAHRDELAGILLAAGATVPGA